MKQTAGVGEEIEGSIEFVVGTINPISVGASAWAQTLARHSPKERRTSMDPIDWAKIYAAMDKRIDLKYAQLPQGEQIGKPSPSSAPKS
jgi:hypothetical protein